MIGTLLTHPDTYSYGQVLDATILYQIVCTFCYLVSTLVVMFNFYAGFVGILTGLVYAAFCGLAYYGLRVKVSRPLFGVVLGGACILTFVSLESAIFWGQYGNCESYSDSLRALRTAEPTQRGLVGVDCSRQSAMKSVCAFSALLFLGYLFLLGLLLRFKNDILSGAAPEPVGYAVVSTVALDDPADGRGAVSPVGFK